MSLMLELLLQEVRDVLSHFLIYCKSSFHHALSLSPLLHGWLLFFLESRIHQVQVILP